MAKLIAFALGLYILWEPTQPVRQIAADALSYSAEQIRH
jgi:hypothetical protein